MIKASVTKTVKNKNRPIINKAKIWNEFDTEIKNKDTTLECIYRNNGDRECCEYCEYNLAFSDEGFLTCTNPKCGIIYKDVVDFSAEYRYYGANDNNNSDPTRCGLPINPLLSESSYGCKVLSNNSMSYEMRKVKRYTEWQAMPYKEKSQYDEFQQITLMAQNAGMPKIIINDAIKYHKKISEYKTTFRGDNRDGIIAASIYISCRVNNYPRTAKEISNIFHLDSTSATKGCKNAQVIINDIEKNEHNDEKTILCKTTPRDFIERYCSKLNINNELTKLCIFISLKIEKENIMPENTPHSIAAGIVYFISIICNLNINKLEIKTISEISEVTINKCYKKMEKIKNKLLPDVILNKYT